MTKPAKATVQLVADDDAVRDSLKVLLQSHDFAVEAYASTEALLSESSAVAAICLLLDLHVPVGSGLSALSALHARGIDLPSILITGRIGKMSATEARRAGAAAILEKPVDEGVLLAAIARAAGPELGLQRPCPT